MDHDEIALTEFGGKMFKFRELDLGRNLTVLRQKNLGMPQRVGAARLIAWKIDEDTGSKFVEDLITLCGWDPNSPVYMFNSMRKEWAENGCSVDLEIYVPRAYWGEFEEQNDTL